MKAVPTAPSQTGTGQDSSTAGVGKKRLAEDQTDTNASAKKKARNASRGAGAADDAKSERKSSGPKLSKAERRQSKQKPFDFSKCGWRNVALKFVYLGENYHGFAAQEVAEGSTVEDELLRALLLTKLIRSRDTCGFTRCGRTDKGVSAMGQVVSLYLRSNLSSGVGMLPAKEVTTLGLNKNDEATERALAAAAASKKGKRGKQGEKKAESGNSNAMQDDRPSTAASADVEMKTEHSGSATNSKPEAEPAELDYALMLNGCLPPDIRVVAWAAVPLEFHARFSCVGRVYKYFFFADGMDLTRMQQAASSFVGDHDFRNFCKLDVTGMSHFMRGIRSFTIRPADEDLQLDYSKSFQEACTPPDNKAAGNSADSKPPPSIGNASVYAVVTEGKADSSASRTNNASNKQPQSSNGGSASLSSALHPDTWCVMTIEGNAFLYHQVRCMAAVLFLVGRGLEDASVVAELLDVKKHPQKPVYDMAPEFPLVLYDCLYPPSIRFLAPPGLAMPNLRRSFADMHCTWRNKIVHAKLAQTCFEHFENNMSILTQLTKGDGEASTSERDSDGKQSQAQAAELTTGLRGQQFMLAKRDNSKSHPYSRLLKRPVEKTYADKVGQLKGRKLAKKLLADEQSKFWAEERMKAATSGSANGTGGFPLPSDD